MKKKYSIQVRGNYRPSPISPLDQNFDILETVDRVIYAEQIGNFNPIFCRYKNNPRVLVHSDNGDLSDPFRRQENYIACLFIKV